VESGKRIGVSQKTEWFINHRLRAMLQETQPELLRDVVQIEGCVMRGKEKNKHTDKKIPGSSGESLKGKTSLQVKAQIVRMRIVLLSSPWLING